MPLPPPSLENAVVVTGASSGIGAELARELAARGYNLVLAARTERALADLADELRAAHAVAVDVEAVDLADADVRAALIARLHDGAREVVGVCNNAGFGSVGRFRDADLERETRMVRLNVEALHELTGAFLGRMVDQGIGAVLNMASIAAHQPLPSMATYAATKAFVVAFSEAVHAELAGTGVSVTTVCPGPTRTDFGRRAGLGSAEGQAPELAFMTAPDVAAAAIEAMVAGRRSVTPGLANKALGLGGRLVPRSLLLPLASRVGARRLMDGVG
jgi:short-subunit dehydrogenase